MVWIARTAVARKPRPLYYAMSSVGLYTIQPHASLCVTQSSHQVRLSESATPEAVQGVAHQLNATCVTFFRLSVCNVDGLLSHGATKSGNWYITGYVSLFYLRAKADSDRP